VTPGQVLGDGRAPVPAVRAEPLVPEAVGHEAGEEVGRLKSMPVFTARSEKPYPGRLGTTTSNASAGSPP